MKKIILSILIISMSTFLLTGCGETPKEEKKVERPRGIAPDPNTATNAKQFDKF
ncbi:MAG: hypothetical protein RBS24_06100 [Bacilli bacterium]|nr:hypothetical protein [Bacilli bacterium]